VRVLQNLRQLLENQIETTMNSFFGQDWILANSSLETHGRVMEKSKELESLVPVQKTMKDPSFCSTCISVREMLTPIAQISGHYATIAQITINRALQATEGVLPSK
jgi:hypothetical protein